MSVVTILATVGFCALLFLGDGFRRSFGASENGALKVSVTWVVQAALLASLALPSQVWLMHLVAIIVIGLLAASFWVFRQSSFVGITGVGYCGLWLGYYCQALSGIK